MAVDERARRELYEQLTEVLGAEATSTLMDLLPARGWAEVATKADLAASTAEVRAEITALRAEMDQRFGAVDARFSAIEHRLDSVDGRFDTLEHRLDTVDGRFDTLEHRLVAQFRGEIITQTRTMIFALVSTVAAVGGIALGLARVA